ncbi:MAG: L-erythro-3,5-diaminohexanoate dehydrogenase [Pseudomonadota bacterium]
MAVLKELNKKADPFGIHRVLDKTPTLPQAADRLNNELPIFNNEILIEVEHLNIDAASFVQMEKETGGNAARIGKIILENCRTRGKQQNRESGSGGMLVGRVKQIGSKYSGPLKFKVGDRIATLVSLTLTPLYLDEISSVDLKTHQIAASGHAVLFETGIAAKLPNDLPEKVAMALFDVAGAPALVYATARKGQNLLVIGAGGKAGTLSCVAGRQKVGSRGKVFAIEPNPGAVRDLKKLGVCDEVWTVDATDPLAVRRMVERATHGKLCDVVINVASVPNTEVSALMSCGLTGKIIFFSMATSFTKVALGAEGISSSAELLFGNGYYPKHAEFVVKLARENEKLKKLFISRYGR